jgi:hypothetical protein
MIEASRWDACGFWRDRMPMIEIMGWKLKRSVGTRKAWSWELERSVGTEKACHSAVFHHETDILI